MFRGILVGTIAVLLLFLGTSVWSLYHMIKSSGPRPAVGLMSIVPSTLLNPLFWIGCMVAFFACYYTFRTV
jgi:hypothetical protein